MIRSAKPFALLIAFATGVLGALSTVPLLAQDGQWLMYSGSYSSHRFSPLTQITADNVSKLRPVWVYQPPGTGSVESTPVVVNGVMYVTSGPTMVAALDLKSGKPLWEWTRPIASTVLNLGFPRVNRGVAVLDNMVYAGSIAGHLAALDAKSGALRWDVAVDDNKIGYYLTLAPLAIDGKIIVGVSGAENGIRGFVDAYDAKTGKRVWRRHTIPAPGEPGNESWGGKDSWKTGGGSTWLTGSYDPELKLLYWQVGNPGPDWNGDFRPGDNLYTCSVLAINPDDGSMKWHFQFTPHDTHDWDANETVVLFDATVNGRARKLLAQANRNGFYYVLDRATGEFITGTPFVKQTWADGLDAKGRPVTKPGLDPNPEGILVYPSIQGAANWHAPSYSPKTNLFYQTAVEMGTIYYKGEAVYKPGIGFTAGGGRTINGDDAWSAVRALEATTGKLKWEFKLLSAGRSSLLSTAGGLVFGGTEEGNFFALDADTGKPLWDTQLGANIRGIPVSFAVDGKQYVAIAAGFALFVYGLP
jgi:alcohol dehydrogenase (cytochrome c)